MKCLLWYHIIEITLHPGTWFFGYCCHLNFQFSTSATVTVKWTYNYSVLLHLSYLKFCSYHLCQSFHKIFCAAYRCSFNVIIKWKNVILKFKYWEKEFNLWFIFENRGLIFIEWFCDHGKPHLLRLKVENYRWIHISVLLHLLAVAMNEKWK
jgi:hypothetical protein